MSTPESTPATKVAPAAKAAPAKTAASKAPAAKKSVAAKPEENANAVAEAAPTFVAQALSESVLGTPAASVAAAPAAAQTATAPEEAEETSMELPIEFWATTSPGPDPRPIIVLNAFGTGCLDCGDLVVDPDSDFDPSADKPRCHFSRGNQFCPAKSARIEFVGERNQMVSKIMKARESRDSNRVLRLMAELGERPASFRDSVLRDIGML